MGTHTSYKRAIPPADYRLIAAMNPKAAQELDYAHTMLTSPGRAAANCLCWAMCWRNWR
ncbi:MAG: hypothetical protein KGJ57_15185 [Sphingomonadales bacterium]|nr:hypothetical protein [Sphingomonadales bacterium]MDE2170748.1 hypothetical protein [Sphingomonadales bacterium]